MGVRWLYRLVPDILDALAIVRPETVVRWLSLSETLYGWRMTANRVMFVPDDRFSQVAGMRADQALPIEGTA